MSIELPDGWVAPDDFDLIGVDGNAFAIIGYTTRALRRAGNPKEVITAFSNEAMSGDYDHVIQAAMTYGGELRP